MSNGGELVWVSDIDDYIDIDYINHQHFLERKELQLQAEIDEIGNIQLLSGKSLSANILRNRGIPPAEWRWAVHEAERALEENLVLDEQENRFVKQLILLGQPYAVRRYAKWEHLHYESALTATLSFGFKALLDAFLRTAGLASFSGSRGALTTALQSSAKTVEVTAYERTGLIQSTIHEIARTAFGSSGHQKLDKESMRTILSLTRLHFSVAELSAIRNFRDLRNLDSLYTSTRRNHDDEPLHAPPTGGRRISNWRLRHLYPLPHLYPYVIRYALARALQDYGTKQVPPERSVLVNELALAKASLRLMRKAGRGR